MKVLLIEDDAETACYVARGLRDDGHLVDHEADGRTALFLGTEQIHDVMIVDRMLPRLDGLSVVKALRAVGVRTPVLYLTTMSGIDDRVEGLEAGGDDYLVKPFALAELLARVKALARRPGVAAEGTRAQLSVGDLEMDVVKREVKRSGIRIDLQPQEFKLLEYLMRHAGRIVTRTMLLENVWDFHFEPRTSVVESHISRLRSKIGRGSCPDLIHTIRGSGYCLRAPK
jgi:two-component system OmpR family response regulator